MIQSIFNRYERKYMLTHKQKEDMLIFLKDYMTYDSFSEDGKAYSIFSIYFDTKDFSIIRNSIAKPKYKDKLRLRSYTCPVGPDDLVFLEIRKNLMAALIKDASTLNIRKLLIILKKG